jgi:hypothetical protein
LPIPWNGSSGIQYHCVDEIQHSDCGATFGFDPKAEVLPELWLKDRDPVRNSLHLTSLDAVPRPFQAWSALAPLVVMPIGDAVRCVATVRGVSLHEAGECGGRKKGDIARSTPANDHDFLLVHHPIEKR